MKKQTALSFFTLLVFFQGQSQSIQNAGFEKGNTSDWVFTNPAYYKFAEDSGYTYTIVNVAKEGKSAAQLTNTGKGQWCQLRQKIFYKSTGGSEKVRLSAYVKTKDIHTGYASLAIRPIQDGKLLPFVEGTKLDSTRGWTKLYVDIVLPSGTDSLLLFCSMIGDGTSWFDDIRLEKPVEHTGQSVSAKQYLNPALAFIDRIAFNKDSIDLKALVAEARIMRTDAKTISDYCGANTYSSKCTEDRKSAENAIGMYHHTL